MELRDGGQPWLGKGVDAAVTAVTEHIAQALVGMPVDDQRMLDETIVELDGTGNKARLGANATLGASLRACMLALHSTSCRSGATSAVSRAA